jgi:hypothetical protein
VKAFGWFVLAFVVLVVLCIRGGLFHPDPHENSSARVVLGMVGIPLLWVIFTHLF